ncbi:HYC_CC_PP family protein [Winogradskyella ludwigii]|uniref:HYC_CC_PP family protein n=1 Tax=Winogradskyella ludwigii TaxID=2686076 RepID=UPI0015CC6A6F|nr:hypothetical protein [Winogradskyella ludwigii]
MKFSYTYKTISIALSLLVLLSTLSLTIDKHFCGDVLIDVAIFSEPDKCADDVVNFDTSETINKTCCKDEIDVIEGINQLTINAFEDLEPVLKQVLFAYTYSYINLFEEVQNLSIPHKDYSPPILIKDIVLLDETYLI